MKLVTFAVLAATLCAGVPGSAAGFATLYDLLSSTKDLSEALKLFNYTGLLPLTQNPNTTITCFLPSNKYLNAADLIAGWEGGSPSWNPQPGRYVWALLLHHCLDGQTSVVLANLTAKTYNYKSAFVWRYQTVSRLATSSVRVKVVTPGRNATFISELGETARVIQPDLRGGKSVVHVIDNGDLYPVFAPPDSYPTLADYADWVAPSAAALFDRSSLKDVLASPSVPFTAFVPSDQAFTALLKTLKVNLTTLLSKQPVVDLLARAHIVNGSALFSGALIRYPGPLRIDTLAGPVNVTTDLAIFPNRFGSAKYITLSTAFSSGASLGDGDVGGSSNDEAPPVVPWVAHSVGKVLLPVSTTKLKQMLAA